MDDRAIISLLSSLAQLDIDACHAYRRVVEGVGVPEIRGRLTEFWRDHERHVDELSAEIHRLGGAPPAFERDAKGILIDRFTALRARTGTTGALRALKSNERLTNAAYAAALREDLPETIGALLKRNREDERRHLDFVREMLAAPEHRGPPLGTMIAGAALITAGAAAAAWAWRSWRGGTDRAGTEETRQPSWLVRRAPPGARLASAPERDGPTDVGDEAQHQMPGEPANLALHARGDREGRDQEIDEAAKGQGGLP
jgi:hypothetical protein